MCYSSFFEMMGQLVLGIRTVMLQLRNIGWFLTSSLLFPKVLLSPAFIACRLLDRSHSDWREMVPHSGFDLHFSDNEC